jgi:ribosome-binding ATPase YchF (GTP1/OBG family)
LKAAFIGLNQSGKSTILAALSGKELQTSVNMSIEEVVVAVPDDRIEWLSGIYNPKKKNYATINCLDLPGMSFADDGSRTTARKLLAQVKTVDMLVLVIRAFENDSVAAYKGTIDAKRDLLELKTEILLNDLEMVANRIDRLQIEVKKPSKRQGMDKAELELMLKLQDALENEKKYIYHCGKHSRNYSVGNQRLDIKSKIYYIAILNNICFAFQSHFSCCFYSLFVSKLLNIIKGKCFSPNKASFNIRVYFSCGI